MTLPDHSERDCPVNGCMVCMPPVAVAIAPEKLDRLKAENRRLRAALHEIDRCCSYGADVQGMTEHGIRDLRRQIAVALDETGLGPKEDR